LHGDKVKNTWQVFVTFFVSLALFVTFAHDMTTTKNGIRYHPSPENMDYIRKKQAKLIADNDVHFGLSRVIDLLLTKARKCK
tara:strand:+ start:923 stop:1168 length:246 start_codon:yes stop_codon:yes gene_type:complete